MEQRLADLHAKLQAENLDGLLISNKENRFYLSGFTGSSAVFLITPTKKWIITDFRYFEQLKTEAPDFEVIDHHGESLLALARAIQELGLQQVGFEQSYLNAGDYLALRKLIPDTSLVPTSNLIESLRMIKDEQELAIMEKAAQLTDQTFDYFLSFIQPGMTEQAAAAKVDHYMREIGGSASAFETIVASGWRSALPHGHASDKVIQEHELITLDFGIVYQRYYSDMTRTISLGTVDAELQHIYQLVKEAHDIGISQAHSGMTGKEVDVLCRDHITKNGYGSSFGHGTGHGIGLSCHEYPSINQQAEICLQPNMFFTVEPGIYLPNKGGVRIEDDVRVLADGTVASLTKSKTEWVEL